MFVNKKFDFSLPKSREFQQSCLLNVQQLFKYPGASFDAWSFMIITITLLRCSLSELEPRETRSTDYTKPGIRTALKFIYIYIFFFFK